MLAVRFQSEDPARHLACDEALLRHADAGQIGECLRLYEITEPTVVLGVSSRWEQDVWPAACRRAGVPILRRVSGGGAVLLGSGCLNYAVLLDAGARGELRSVRPSYRWILSRLIAALAPHGIECAQAGLSDLAVAGRKVGGSAQKRGKRMVLHHGTLLYDFRTEDVAAFLREPEQAPDYRNGRPHTQFVANLPVSGTDLRHAVRTALDIGADAGTQDMSEALADQVGELVRGKYRCDGWNLRR